MAADYGLWNAVVSTATLAVVAATAIAALRQLRHLRAQNTLNGLLKVLDDWRDPRFQALVAYARAELPRKTKDPAYFADLDDPQVDRERHPELHLCDWYEQLGAYLKHGVLDERILMDVSSGSSRAVWLGVQPVVEFMRRRRGDSLYENFEYYVARGVLFERAHPNGCYPADTPRLRDLLGTPEAR